MIKAVLIKPRRTTLPPSLPAPLEDDDAEAAPCPEDFESDAAAADAMMEVISKLVNEILYVCARMCMPITHKPSLHHFRWTLLVSVEQPLR